MIEGRQVGTTPLSLNDVRVGSHAVRLEREGYQIWIAPVKVTASTGVPSGSAPNGWRRAVAAFADPAIVPASTIATNPFVRSIIIISPAA